MEEMVHGTNNSRDSNESEVVRNTNRAVHMEKNNTAVMAGGRMVQVRQSLAWVAGILAAGDGDGETLEHRAFFVCGACGRGVYTTRVGTKRLVCRFLAAVGRSASTRSACRRSTP